MTHLTRREFVQRTALSAAMLHLAENSLAAEPQLSAVPEALSLGWLEAAPAEFTGTTWGVPWARGTCRNGTAFALETNAGIPLPVQTWTLAYWDDGSIKWTAHALAADTVATSAELRLVPGKESVKGEKTVIVQELGDGIMVDTGVVQYRIPRQGKEFVSMIARGGKTLAESVHLICLRKERPEEDEQGNGPRQEHFQGNIASVVVEQNGPVRAVVRIEGKHQAAGGKREWLPFTIRLYFYAGSESARLMHTVIFDGDENKDFISGLGIRFAVPLSDTLTDRHIRFAGEEGGVWGEAVRTLTGLRRDPGVAVRAAQVAGRATPPAPELPDAVGKRLELIPAWGDFSLSQLTADGFQIRKRTRTGHAWIRAGAGHRAGGLGYVGGATGGGIAFGLRNFWQRHPTQLDIRNAAKESAEVTVWLWSPDAPTMDLRFYHDGMGMTTHPQEREGLEITYEDYEKGWGTPYGVGRTSEMQLWALETTPARERFAAFAQELQNPPLLTCQPERLHAAGVFSNWSLPIRETPAQKTIEDQLDYLIELYKGQVEQRRWYGFWDHGDVMHSYDRDRHEWCYDVGGFAWANSELSPDLWLWYSFLRSGRSDIFRLAEAMTRHTSEVDTYHVGPYRGFGSRHNVQHWGDSSKQPRVSTATYRRIYYFLTADERTGDLMREPLDSDRRLQFVDIGRKLRPQGAPPLKYANVGFGTDWCSLAAAWLTEWERTGDVRWRDKLRAGMETIGALPKGWFAGGTAYDPETGRFLGPGDTVGISHLNAVFGAVEINAELLALLEVPEYRKTWLAYCRAYNASPAEQEKIVGAPLKKLNLGEAHSRLTAYAASQTDDPALAARAWKEFFGGAAGIGVHQKLTMELIAGSTVLHPVDEGFVMSTNAASQWGLAAIENLALIGNYLPSEIPTESGTPPGADTGGGIKAT